jgi:hypothetical protein
MVVSVRRALPSLWHCLIWVKLDRAAIPGATPYERMLYVLGRITRTMQRERRPTT